jgi:hypothetical protein
MVVGDWTVTQPYEAPAAPEPAAETSRHAITAFTWAVLGWTAAPLIGTVLALIYAQRADRAVQRDPSLRGIQLAGAARSLAVAWILFFLVVVAVAIGVALGALGVRDALCDVGDC